MIVLLLGPPGSGKGTQAKMLSQKYHWPQLSTGHMLRLVMEERSPLGEEARFWVDQGKLVPDTFVIALVKQRMSAADCEQGFILDGFPRNLDQAKTMDVLLETMGRKLDRVVFLRIGDDSLLRRLSGRRTCLDCGMMFHLDHIPSKQGDACDVCGGVLIQRSDDASSVIQDRLEVYRKQTEPLVKYYQERNLLSAMDATLSPEEVGKAIQQVLF
jgi:adenylate kinase